MCCYKDSYFKLKLIKQLKMENQSDNYQTHTKRSLDQKIDLLQENHLYVFKEPPNNHFYIIWQNIKTISNILMHIFSILDVLLYIDKQKIRGLPGMQ